MSALPLDGRRIVVLRAAEGPDRMRDALCAEGADATTVAVADVVDRSDAELRSGVGDLAGYRWVVVTSRHGARRLQSWADAWPPATRIGAVGPSTAECVAQVGLPVDAVAPEGTARSLADALDGGPVLFLAAATARDDLARELASRGVELTTVVAYDVVRRELADDDRAQVVASDAIVAMAPVAIDALDALPDTSRAVAVRIPLVAIGPTTAARAAALDWPVTQVASSREPPSVCASVRALRAR